MTNYVNSINSHLDNIQKSWINVANEFSDAKDTLDKKDFKKLSKDTRISYSIVCKLIKIAKSDRLKEHKDKLKKIDAWSTLHEIAKLDDEQFKLLDDLYLSGDNPRYIKRSDVEKIRNGGVARKRSEYNVLATVRVKVSAMNYRHELDPTQTALDVLEKSLSSIKNVEIELVDLAKKLPEQPEDEVELAKAA